MNTSSSTSTARSTSSSSSLLPRFLADPTRAFSLLVLAIMSLRYLAAHDWQFSLLRSGFFGHYQVLLALVLASLPYFKNLAPSHLAATSADLRTAEWYWWNAWLYHAVMDGLSGSFQQIPVVVHQYFILDRRFETHHVVPWLIGCIELFVMAPLCVWTIHCILQKHPLRWPLELITSTFQLFGMIVFVVAEVYEGQTNIPALDPVGSIQGNNRWANVKFNWYHVTYYWFGFWFCNLVWGVVPVYRIVRAMQECQRAFATLYEKGQQQDKNKNL